MELEQVAALQDQPERTWSCAWSPSGTSIATCGADGTVRVYAQEGKDWRLATSIPDAHTRTVRSVAWSPCGTYLTTASFDGCVCVWRRDGDGFESIATLEGHENEVKCAAWDSAGNLLATCSRDKSVWIWEMTDDLDFECVAVLHGHSQDVKSVVWHPSKELLASTSYDNTIRLWVEDEDEWYCSSELQGHTSTVWQCAFDASVSCSEDGCVIVWAAESSSDGGDPRWRSVSTLTGAHRRSIFSVDWTPLTGLVATGCGDDAIRVISVQANMLERQDASLEQSQATCSVRIVQEQAHRSDVNTVRWNPKHRDILASVGDDGVLRIWRLPASLVDIDGLTRI